MKLTGARKKPAALRFQVKRSCRGLIYPGGASHESPASVSTNSHTANSAPLEPAYPPSLPAGREVPRKSGRDSLPRPSRPKAYLRGEALSRPSGPGMPEVSPTLHSRREKNKSCALRLYSHRFSVSRPNPGLVPGQERALGNPECYRVRVPKRVGGREKG